MPFENEYVEDRLELVSCEERPIVIRQRLKMWTTKATYFFIGFLVILVISLIIAIIVITYKNKDCLATMKANTNSLATMKAKTVSLPTMKANTVSLPTIKANTLSDSQEDDMLSNSQFCTTKECDQLDYLISSSMDVSVDPCDDFYQYACGNWQKDYPIENDDDIIGLNHFKILSDNIRNKLRDLLIETKERDEAKYLKPLYSLFHECTNTDARDKAGFSTLKSLIKDIGGWPLIEDNWDEYKYDLTNALIVLNRKFNSPVILGINVHLDKRNTSQTSIYINNPFEIPTNKIVGIYSHPEGEEFDTSYDMENNPVMKVAELLKGSSINKFTWILESYKVIALSKKLEQITSPVNVTDTCADHEKFIITIKQLMSQYNGIDWIRLLKGIFINANVTIKETDYVVVTDHNYFSKLSAVINSESNTTIANYISSLLIPKMILWTTTKAMKIMIPEISQQLPELCSSIVTLLFPNLIGRLYIDKQFNRESIKDLKTLFEALKEAFNELLDENQWMDSETKTNAKSKLEAISVNIASPDFTLNDNELQSFINDYKNIDSEDFLKSVLTISEINMNKQWKSLRTPLPKSQWPQSTSAATVNAFYYIETNAIYIPAAIAQFPFFQHNGSLITNIGAIGTAIGHELTHAFDTSGKCFDKEGNLANWWTTNTNNKFNNKTKCFLDQYNEFGLEGVEKMQINGKKTLGENIADNGGVREAFRALQKMKKRNQLNKLPGKMSTFTHEQIFFLSFANVWCSNKSPKGIKYQIDYGVHSPDKARVLGTLSNFDEFSKAFNCKVGSEMNLNTDKCLLW